MKHPNHLQDGVTSPSRESGHLCLPEVTSSPYHPQCQWRPNGVLDLHAHPAVRDDPSPPHWGGVGGGLVQFKDFQYFCNINETYVGSRSKALLTRLSQGSFREGLVESWNFHLHPAVIRREAKWGTWTSIPPCSNKEMLFSFLY